MIGITRTILLVLAFAVSAGCNHKNTRSNNASFTLNSPTYLNYFLPETMVIIDAKYTLKACNPLPLKDGQDPVEIDAKFSLVATPIPDTSRQFAINFDKLPKSRTAQDITITLSDSGILKSVNSTAEDKTGAIISNVLGIVTKAVGIGNLFGTSNTAMFWDPGTTARPPLIKTRCTTEAEDFLSEVAGLSLLIEIAKDERRDIDPDTSSPEKTLAKLQSYDRHIQLLEARKALIIQKKLMLKVKHRIDLKTVAQQYEFGLTIAQLKDSKWLDFSSPMTAKHDAVQYASGILIGKLIFRQVATRSVIDLKCKFPYVDSAGLYQCATTEVLQLANGAPWVAKEDRLYFLRPFVTEYAVIKAKSTVFDTSSPLEIELSFNKIAHLEKPPHGRIRIPQWGRVEMIEFDVGVFEKRTVKLTQDDTGYVSILSMNKDAQLAASTGAIAGIAKSTADLAAEQQSGADVAELAYLKREVELRNKRKELQKLLDEENEL